MKKTVVALSVALVLVTGVALFASAKASRLQSELIAVELMHQNTLARLDAVERELQPFKTKRAATTKIDEEFNLPAGKVQSLSFNATLAPGTLSGKWRASGKGWGVADDTISGFRITDPDDMPLDSSLRTSSGSFLVKVARAGKHSFYFENAGLFRATPRRVFVEAEFKPD